MLEMQGLIKFFDTGFILRLFMLILLVSLFPVAEIFLLIRVSEFLNIYMLTAALMILSFTGFIIGLIRIRITLKRIKRDINEGIFPERRFFILIGNFAAALLLVLPGFVSFIMGIIILFPGLNARTGKLLNGSSKQKMKEVYEYLKLYDL